MKEAKEKKIIEIQKKQKIRHSFTQISSLHDNNESINKPYSNIFKVFVKDLHDEKNDVHNSFLDKELQETMFNSFTNDLTLANMNDVKKNGTPGRPVGTPNMIRYMRTKIYKDMVDNITLCYIHTNKAKIDTLKLVITTCQNKYNLLDKIVPHDTIKAQASHCN